MKTRHLLASAMRSLLRVLGGQTESPYNPQQVGTVTEWINHDCKRSSTARFPSGAAYVALRRYRAARLQPFPSRQEFHRLLDHLGFPRDAGSFVGIGPLDPEAIKPAGLDSVADWLETRTETAPDAVANAELAWADYARSVAPRVPSRRFYTELAALGYPRVKSQIQGFSLASC